MNVIFENGLADLSQCQSGEDVPNLISKVIQMREYEILLACGLNLTSFTSADVVKMIL